MALLPFSHPSFFLLLALALNDFLSLCFHSIKKIPSI